MTDLRVAARILGGEVSGRAILCPGAGHSARDRSLSVLFSASAPDGVLVFDHAHGDHLGAKDYVKERLGFSARDASRKVFQHHPPAQGVVATTPGPSNRTALALRIWHEAGSAAGSPVEVYLNRRGLALPNDANEVLRYHPACAFAGTRIPAMVALTRDVRTDAPMAVHRTALDLDGNKIEVAGRDRLALGPLAGGAVKLTADAEVTLAVGIAEGIETALSLQRLPEFGASPAWSVLNAAGVAAFPPLPGVEVLWIGVDNDPAGLRAAETCAERWRAADKEVVLVKATVAGADLNDLREARHA